MEEEENRHQYNYVLTQKVITSNLYITASGYFCTCAKCFVIVS